MKNFIRSLYETIYASRREKAEREIAYHIWSTEYKHESFDYVLTMVRLGKTHELVGGCI